MDLTTKYQHNGGRRETLDRFDYNLLYSDLFLFVDKPKLERYQYVAIYRVKQNELPDSVRITTRQLVSLTVLRDNNYLPVGA